MTPEETDLARQLVALPGWSWSPGMLFPSARGGTGKSEWVRAGGRHVKNGHMPANAIPDLLDAATAGPLLVMLMAAEPHGAIWWSPTSKGWAWRRWGSAFLSPADVVEASLGVMAAKALIFLGRCA